MGGDVTARRTCNSICPRHTPLPPNDHLPPPHLGRTNARGQVRLAMAHSARPAVCGGESKAQATIMPHCTSDKRGCSLGRVRAGALGLIRYHNCCIHGATLFTSCSGALKTLRRLMRTTVPILARFCVRLNRHRDSGD